MSIDWESARDYLTPRRICVAAAATAPSTGTPGCRFLPAVLHLALDPCSTPGFRDILLALHEVPLHSNTAESMVDDPAGYGFDQGYDDAETVADYLLRTVRQLDSPDALNDFLDTVVPEEDRDSNLLHGLYDYDGQIGCFLRKVSVMYAALSFDAAVDLYDSFCSYVASANDPQFDINYAAGHDNTSDSFVDDRTVAAGGAEVDAVGAAFRLSSGVPVASSQDYVALRTMSRARAGRTHGQPAADFAMHLEALRRRDYSSALDALHRYYDMSLAQISSQVGLPLEVSPDGARSGGTAGGGADASAVDTRGHQYAALSLSALHFHLGHPELAGAALDDALRAAQQCGDDACQARALSWIALTSTSPEKRHQLFLHVRDRLALAREELQTVVTPFAKEANAKLTVQPRSDDSFWRHEERHHSAVAAARMQRILSRVGFDRADLSVDSLLLSSAAWESHASISTALTVARIALRGARRSSFRKCQKILTSEEARAMIAVASLEAKCGRANTAISDLVATVDSSDNNRIKPDFAVDHSSSRPEREMLQRTIKWLRFERALRRGEIRVAGHLVESISAFASRSTSDSDLIFGPDASLDAIEARCRWCLASHAFVEAAELANRLAREAAVLTRPARVVDGLRLTAQAHIHAGASSSALSSALSAVSLARGLGLEAAHVRAVLTLTDAMLRMDSEHLPESAAAAMRTLDPVLPHALEGLGMEERGRARRLQAECILGNAASVNDCMSDVVGALQDGIDAYTLAEDRAGLRDCWYIFARVQYEVGNISERNCAAKEFKHIINDLARAKTVVVP